MEKKELQQLLDMVECGVFTTHQDTDMELIYANARFFEMIQYTPEEFAEKYGSRLLDAVLPEDKQKIRSLIARQRVAGGKLQLEFRIKKGNGLVAWLSFAASRARDDGQMVYFCSCMDITQVKRTMSEVYQAKRDMDLIANNIPGGVLKVRMTDFEILYANDSYYRLVGFSKEEYHANFGKHVNQLVYPPDQEMVQQQLKVALANRGNLSFEYRIVAKSGEVRWSYINGCRIEDDEEGRPVFLCVIMDITARKKLESEFENTAKRAETISNLMRETLWSYDLVTGNLSRNGNLLADVLTEDAIKENYWMRQIEDALHPEELPKFRKNLRNLMMKPGESCSIYRIRNGNGDYQQMELGCISLNRKGDDEKPDCIYGMARLVEYRDEDPFDADIAVRTKHLEGKLVQMAKGAQAHAEDTTTNLLSYHQFLQQAESQLAKRSDEDRYALFCADIDEFHKYSSSYGYSLSAELLKQYSEVLHKFLIEDGFCSRVDGDYFVGLTSYKSHKDLLQILAKMVNYQEQLLEREEQQIPYSTTVGLYLVEPEDHELGQMLEKADLARRSIKGLSNNTYAIYTEDLQKIRSREEDIIQQIWQAMKNQTADICYLPRIQGSRDKIIGCKVVTRVLLRDGQYIESDALQRYIERGGILKEVAFYSLRQVCNNIGAWKAKGNDVIPFALEVTARQLSRRNAVAMIDDIVVRQNKLKPSDVIFELPERYFDNMTNTLRETLEQICKRGYQVVISRFGADHTAVQVLRELPVTGIKFHGEYFEHMTSERERIILSSIVEMAGKLGMSVYCGGIGTKLQEEYARSLGIEILEGEMYYGAMRSTVFEKCFLEDKSEK